MIGRLKVSVTFSDSEQAEETFDATSGMFSESEFGDKTLTIWATREDLVKFFKDYLKEYCT